MYLPLIDAHQTSRITTDAFPGLSRHLKIGAGEMEMMTNLTSDSYPMMAVRCRRGVAGELTNPQGMVARDVLCWVDNGILYVGGEAVEGLSLTADGPKQLVSMGAYLVIFPDGDYVNLSDLTDYGSINNEVSVTGATISLCRSDGSLYDSYQISATEPEDPGDGTLWLDTSTTPHALKQFSASSGMWVSIASTYLRIASGGINVGFESGDGVEITGINDDLDQTYVLHDVGDGYVIVTGIIDSTITVEGTVTLSRSAPDMDFVIESGNRLWGCKYGMVDGEAINELYCSKLGDMRNWRVYQGVSTDAWAASVGSDGVFTGAVDYLGSPIFFKETCMHRISVSSYGAHQVTSVNCNGVQDGSWRSLVMVDGSLYYKGRTNIYRYDGSYPNAVGDKLGHITYYDAVAGSVGKKYYVSMRDSDGWHLMAYDTSLGFWHREDDTHALYMASIDDDIYWIDSNNRLISGRGTSGTLEESVHWDAVSGIQTYEYYGHKYTSRYCIRMQLPAGSSISLYLQYDSDGEWHHAGTINGTGTNSFIWPVRPRRCDHLKLKLSGDGDCKIFAVYRILEQGSDGG